MVFFGSICTYMRMHMAMVKYVCVCISRNLIWPVHREGKGGGGEPRERRYAPFVRCCCLEKEKEKNTPTRFVLLGTPHQNGEGDGEAGKGTNASSLAPDFLPFFFIMSYGMVWYVTVISLHCEIRCRCRGGLDSARIEKEKGEGGSQIRREGI